MEEMQEALSDLIERLDLIRKLVDQLWELKRSGALDDLIQAAAALRFLTEGVRGEAHAPTQALLVAG